MIIYEQRLRSRQGLDEVSIKTAQSRLDKKTAKMAN